MCHLLSVVLFWIQFNAVMGKYWVAYCCAQKKTVTIGVSICTFIKNNSFNIFFGMLCDPVRYTPTIQLLLVDFRVSASKDFFKGHVSFRFIFSAVFCVFSSLCLSIAGVSFWIMMGTRWLPSHGNGRSTSFTMTTYCGLFSLCSLCLREKAGQCEFHYMSSIVL